MSDFAGSADLGGLVKALETASKQAPNLKEQTLDTGAAKIADRMKELAPKKTGRLYMSIVVIKTDQGRIIGPQGVSYAAYQEFGTGIRGEFGGSAYTIKPVRAQRLSFKVNGQWVSTKEVHHPGIPAHPYARPALAEFVDSITSDMARNAANLTLNGKLS